MNRYRFNAVHVIDPNDATTFSAELKAEHRLLTVEVTTTIASLVDRNKAQEIMERTLAEIPEHGDADLQEYCLDDAIDEVHELLIDNTDKLLELAKLDPPRFMLGGDDNTTVIVDLERQDITLSYRDTMDGEADARDLAAFLDSRGLGKVTMMVSYRDLCDTFEYQARRADLRSYFRIEAKANNLDAADPAAVAAYFSEWLTRQVEANVMSESEANLLTVDDCYAIPLAESRRSHLLAAYMVLGYTDGPEYGDGADESNIEALVGTAPYVEHTLRNYGYDIKAGLEKIAHGIGKAYPHPFQSTPEFNAMIDSKIAEWIGA